MKFREMETGFYKVVVRVSFEMEVVVTEFTVTKNECHYYSNSGRHPKFDSPLNPLSWKTRDLSIFDKMR